MTLENKVCIDLLKKLNDLEKGESKERTCYNLSIEQITMIKSYLTNYKTEVSDADIISKYNLTISKKKPGVESK